MAAPSTELMFAGGELIANPVDSGAPDYGGIRLGATIAAAATIEVRTGEIVAEEYGGDPADEIYLGERVTFACVFRGLQPHGELAGFLNTAAGTVDHPYVAGAKLPVITYPGSTVSIGDKLSAVAQDLLYVPTDVTRHPAVRIYNAIPRVGPVPIAWAATEPLAYLVSWVGIRDGSGRVARIAALADQGLPAP